MLSEDLAYITIFMICLEETSFIIWKIVIYGCPSKTNNEYVFFFL